MKPAPPVTRIRMSLLLRAPVFWPAPAGGSPRRAPRSALSAWSSGADVGLGLGSGAGRAGRSTSGEGAHPRLSTPIPARVAPAAVGEDQRGDALGVEAEHRPRSCRSVGQDQGRRLVGQQAQHAARLAGAVGEGAVPRPRPSSMVRLTPLRLPPSCSASRSEPSSGRAPAPRAPCRASRTRNWRASITSATVPGKPCRPDTTTSAAAEPEQHGDPTISMPIHSRLQPAILPLELLDALAPELEELIRRRCGRERASLC